MAGRDAAGDSPALRPTTSSSSGHGQRGEIPVAIEATSNEIASSLQGKLLVVESAGEIPVAPSASRTVAVLPERIAPQLFGRTTGWVRVESRSYPGVFYYWHEKNGETSAEPPKPWILRESLTMRGHFYYWNPQTGETSVGKPINV